VPAAAAQQPARPTPHPVRPDAPVPAPPVSPAAAVTAIAQPPALDDLPTQKIRLGPARGPRDNSQDATELLPPVSRAARREPDLLTHRGQDYDEEMGQPGVPPHRLSNDQQRGRRRKRVWRRVRRIAYTVIALMIIVPVLAFLIAYQIVDVPTPESIAAGQKQAVTLQYADGSELSKIAPEGSNRTMVKYEDIPRQVLNAVYSAEDATFESNAGFDISGVMRAGWNQATGGSGGGSTITQQYIKKATGNEDKTVTRKALEVVKAYKMNNTYDKKDIITAYLNTIYFGRNAYGVAAAAWAYYGKQLKDVTAQEAALLAGMIQNPSRFKDDEYMQRRWNYVMDQLVANQWFPAEQRAAQQYPQPLPFEQTKSQALTGPRAHIEQAAINELASGDLGLTLDDIQQRGYTIVTTIDQTAQTLAEQAVDEVMKGQPDNLFPGLVAVDPKSGQVKAYYGGKEGHGTDWAATRQEPGSSFKPFDLVALLQKGKGLGETYNGTSPRTFDGLVIRNSSNSSCGEDCTVAEAMKKSINTVFYDIAVNVVGTQKVADAARQAGITSALSEGGAAPTAGIAIGGDKTRVSTLEMASSYATFAAGGVRRPAHLVAKVLNPDGSVYWQAPAIETPAFDQQDAKRNAKISRNVTEALLPIPEYSKIACADGRLCAAKTGTHQLGETEDNAKAWTVGYTPQLSTAVSMSADKGGAIKDARGRIIYGAGLPGQIWKTFMDSYHKTFKLPKESFGKYEPIGKPASASTSASPTSGEPGRQKPGRTRRTEDPTLPTFPTFPTLPSG
jgi:membrane peptidoglycan carboxypeptidase